MIKSKKYYLARAKNPIGYNTEIHGVSSNINTPSLLAAKFKTYPTGESFSASNIFNFIVEGNNIKCYVDSDYQLATNAFDSNTSIINYYDYYGKLIRLAGNSCFYNTPKLKNVFLPGCVSIGDSGINHFVLTNLDYLYIPACTVLGSSSADNTQLSGNYTIKKIYANSYLATNNSGNPDGDLLTAISKGSSVRYVSSFTSPNPVIDLSSGDIYANSIQLNFTAPIGTNTIDFYEIYVNGVFKNIINESGGEVYNLSPNTAYSISIKAVDIFYNKSVLSNFISVSTNSTTTPLRLKQTTFFNPSDLRIYYEMEGNPDDYNSTYHGLCFGNLKYNVNKGIPLAVFNGSDTRVSPPDSSIWNDNQTIVFYARIRNIGAIIYNKSSDYIGGWGVLLSHTLSSANTTIVTTSPATQHTNNISDIKSSNELFHFAFVFDNTNDLMKTYINGIKIGQKAISGSILRGSSIINIGCTRNGNTTSYSQFLDGDIGDFAIIKRVLTDSEIAEF